MREPTEVDRYVATRGEVAPGRLAYERAMFEGCVPQEFWFTTRGEVRHNLDAFQGYVLPYRRRLRRAYNHGYSLLFTGDNGTGKTMFMCYVLGRAVAMGFSVYYTTLKRMDTNIKAGFDDPAAARRLRAMLATDFLAIDELAKEHAKSEFLTSELEEILKARYDDRFPTLLSSNSGYNVLTEMYGPTIASMLEGRYQRVELDGGDFRGKTRGAMRKGMGYRA